MPEHTRFNDDGSTDSELSGLDQIGARDQQRLFEQVLSEEMEHDDSIEVKHSNEAPTVDDLGLDLGDGE